MSAFGGIADIANFKIYGDGNSHVRPDFRLAVSRRLERKCCSCARVAIRPRPLVRRTSGQAADALHPVFGAPAASMSVRAQRRSPLHALLSQIRELQ